MQCILFLTAQYSQQQLEMSKDNQAITFLTSVTNMISTQPYLRHFILTTSYLSFIPAFDSLVKCVYNNVKNNNDSVNARNLDSQQNNVRNEVVLIEQVCLAFIENISQVSNILTFMKELNIH